MGVMPAMMGLSEASSIGTAFSQSAAIKAKGDYDSTVANANASIAGLSAKQTLEAGDIAASRRQLKTQQTVSAIRAGQGASGVDVTSGSSSLTRIGEDFAGRIDAMTIRNNATRQAWGYQTEAIQDTYAGQFAHLAATAKSQQTLITGGLEAVEGPLNIYSKSQYLQRRMGGGAGSGVPFDTSTG